MADLKPLPAAGLEREAIARIEVGQTTARPATVWLLIVGFLAAAAVVPLTELVLARRVDGRTTAWARMAEMPAQMRQRRSEAAAEGRSWWGQAIAANRSVLGALESFETALEDESSLGRALRPPAQAVMSGWLGAGNERVYPGVDGWLFYRPDVDYVAGRGFLAPAEMRRRLENAAEWDVPPQPDPRAALLSFARDLEARGITLIVMPTPVKPGVHPEKLAVTGDQERRAIHNPSYERLLEDLRRANVLVFEPRVGAGVRGTEATYLVTDTHWRPETMEAVAGQLADLLRERIELPSVDDPGHRVERINVTAEGDTAAMLDLPAGASLYPPESVWLRRVLRPDGSLWRSSPDADVLVLGDSFSNIYSLESMGWGTSAGFVEQVSFMLQRPVDRLVQNDQGAFATREMLQQQPGRLAGKRVIVYQFAERELSFGDWRILPLVQ